MTKPLAVISALYMVGAFLGTSLDTYTIILVMLTGYIAILLKLLLFNLGKGKQKVFFIGLVFVLVFLFAVGHGFQTKKNTIADIYDFFGTDVVLTGEVVYVNNTDKVVHIRTKTITNEQQAADVETMVKVTSGEEIDLQVRDFVTVKGKLQKFYQRRYSGDTNQYLNNASKGIHVKLYTNEEIQYHYNNVQYFDLLKFGDTVRRTVEERINSQIEGQQAALLKALLIGDKSDFEDTLQTNLSMSGLSHIAAVSGLHISICISFLSFFFYASGSNRYKAGFLTIIAVFLYCVIIGGQPSVMRAGLMVVYSTVVTNLRGRRDGLTSLMLSGLLMTLFNPYLVHSVSYQLSFFATLGIIVFSRYFRNKMFGVTVSVLLCLSPITAYYFNTVSFGTLFSNIIITPLIMLALPLGYLMCVIPALSFLVRPLMALILMIPDMFARVPFLTAEVASPNIGFFIIYWLLLLLLLAILKKADWKVQIKFGICLAMVVCVCTFQFFYFKDCTKISFVDLGKQRMTHITTVDDRQILINCGSSRYEALNYLKKQNIRELDFIFATGYMAEDIGALPYILDEIQVKRLYLPETEKVYTENFMQAIYSRIAKQDVVYYNKGTLKAAEVQIHISDLNTNPAKKSEGEVTPEILCFREKIPYNTDLSLCGTVEYYVNQDGIKKIYTTRNPQEEY